MATGTATAAAPPTAVQQALRRCCHNPLVRCSELTGAVRVCLIVRRMILWSAVVAVMQSQPLSATSGRARKFRPKGKPSRGRKRQRPRRPQRQRRSVRRVRERRRRRSALGRPARARHHATRLSRRYLPTRCAPTPTTSAPFLQRSYSP